MWLVLGGDGQLGRCLDDVLSSAVIDHRCLSRAQLDITDADRVRDVVAECDPSVVVNAAAWTAVDDAEDHEDAALVINGDGAANVARAAAATGCRLFHVSTDYVFDGVALRPYLVSDEPAPVGAYGRTKLAGERHVAELGPARCHIVRTAWLYSSHGRNFARTMATRALRGEPVRVVDDQRGQPTSAHDLARLLVAMESADSPRGVFHGTNAGEATWCQFATAIYEAIGVDTSLVSPTDSSAYPTRATRPKYSVLDHSGFSGSGVLPMRHWRDALTEEIPGIVEQVRAELQN